LTGIYLKDERFGNADDVVFELNNNILHCIQAKASKTEKEMILSDFFKIPTKKNNSLLQKLYSSYNGLRKNFPNYLLRIEFVTNRVPSTSTRTLPKSENREISLASFYQYIWIPFKNNRISKEDILKDKINEQFIEKFSDHLRITSDELWEFFGHFNFIFGYLPIGSRSHYESQTIESYYNWYLENKKNPEIKGLISLEQFLKDLGISVITHPHDFPIEKSLYVSFPEVKNKIIQGITDLDNGYIFLSGGPNTGKSTFLEAEIHAGNIPNCIFFKYLCFRETSELSLRSRGDLTTFLGDLNNQIHMYIKNITSKNIREQFTYNLKKISIFGKEKRKKIVIIIDGIDHVTREELDKIDKPFTNFLLNPQSLPSNIIFLISGQNFQSISWYESSIDTKFCKNYEMQPFTIDQITRFLKKYYSFEEEIEFQVLQRLFNKTQGNPSYLKHICSNFEKLEDLNENTSNIDTQFLDFEKDWDELFEKYWRIYGFEDNLSFTNVAGLISRIFGPIDITWLRLWPERLEIEKFISIFGWCFKRYSNILLFDHNSFKNYLQKKSISVLGIKIEKEERDFFNKLAQKCEVAGSNSYYSWFKLRYLNNAGKIDEFKIERNFFVEQWMQGRNLSDIIEDLRLLLEYYINNKNVELTFRIIYVKLEFELRKEINKLDTSPDYIFLINPVFQEINDHTYYLVSVILNSLDISPSFKLDLILYLIDSFNLRDCKDLYLLINKYFKISKQNWIEIYHNPDYDENFTKKWLQVALFFNTNADIVIKEYNKFLVAKHKDYFHVGERARYYPILWIMGEFLIENSLFDSLKIIYNILNNIIEQDEWEIISNDNVLYKNKYQSKYLPSERENPFYIFFYLVFRESRVKGNEIFDNFLHENPQYNVLYSNSKIKSWKILNNKNELSEEALSNCFDYGFTVEKSYSFKGDIEIKNRLYLYKLLNDNYGINEEKLLLLFNKMYEKRNIGYRITKDWMKFQWEKVFFELANCIDKPYNNMEEAKPLTEVIEKLFEMLANPKNYIDAFGRRVMINFSLIINIVVEKTAKFQFLYHWFQNNLLKMFKNNVYRFGYFINQISALDSIKKHFNEVNDELLKFVIINAKRNYFSSISSDYWNLSSTIYNILKILSSIKATQPSFYKENLEFFLGYLEIVGFRMYPRKDWQLYSLVYLIKNLIPFIPKKDKSFIEDINWLVEMLNYAEIITERSEIYAVKELFHESIKNWDPDLGNQIYNRLNLQNIHPRDFGAHEKYEEIEILDTFIDDLTKVFSKPQEFLNSIKNFSKELSFEQKYYPKNFEKIIEKLEKRKECTFEGWTKIFEFLIKTGEDKSILSLDCSSFVIEFIKFYLTKIPSIPLNETDINDLELKIEIAKLEAPDYEFFSNSLENLYILDKEKCFKYGWQVISNLFVKLRKYVWYTTYRDFVTYTFLPKINVNNYLNFWNIYMKYLRNLFRIMELSNSD